MSDHLPWEIEGTYLEACNCDPICPCRTVGGRRGGRSTHGLCLGALSWQIESGRAGAVDLSGLRVVLASRYHDDEPGSPWSFFLYLDERGDEPQRGALEEIFLGRLGGSPLKHFPWAWKESHLLAARPVSIEVDHRPGRGWFRAADKVAVRVRGPVEDQEAVTCVIPGHHQPGREVHAQALQVDDGPLDFELTDTCAYESKFAYSSAE